MGPRPGDRACPVLRHTNSPHRRRGRRPVPEHRAPRVHRRFDLVCGAFRCPLAHARGIGHRDCHGISRSSEPGRLTGAAHVAISNNGTLAYMPAAAADASMVSLDLSGTVTPVTPAGPGDFPGSTPNGAQAITVTDDDNALWVWSESTIVRRRGVCRSRVRHRPRLDAGRVEPHVPGGARLRVGHLLAAGRRHGWRGTPAGSGRTAGGMVAGREDALLRVGRTTVVLAVRRPAADVPNSGVQRDVEGL